ncbi:Uncharacterised protein [BD1-7 clade bacterium]|uniref:Outer membrane protein beta-barrel domain-containing protein n=1 Tax=BD1-7 clade bacterium TaxID=2029982 RepID=A0A5S9Q9M0_9GAMM|nr:Uncharacterised protein [BD1-7 clade bacterium]CAA0114908.1 Uncharacterised protein [BD1-7 clade bacterium]
MLNVGFLLRHSSFKHLSIRLVALIAALNVGASFAQEQGSVKDRSNVTFGINAGYAAFKPLGNSAPKYDGSYTTNLYVGYNFTRSFGLEVAYGISGEFKPEDEVQFSGIESSTLRVGPTFWGELNNWLGIYNKIQYADVTLKNKQNTDKGDLSTNGAYYEVGLLWALSPNIGITTSAAYLWTAGDDNNFSQIQGLGGLHFRF